MSPRWRWFLIGYVWALPVTLIGLALAAFYRCGSYRWIGGVLTCVSPRPMWGKPAGQTLGWISMYSDETERGRDYMRVHEYVHVWQTFVLGPLWLVLYGLFFVAEYVVMGGGDWKPAYRKNPFEAQAYAREDAFIADKRPRWGSARPRDYAPAVGMFLAFVGLCLALAALVLAGCYNDARTFPAPLGGPWGSGHCSPMFAAEVMGCTYTDENQRVSHAVCFVGERGAWWCSGRTPEPRR